MGISIERYECDRIWKGKIRMSCITRKNILLNVFGLPEEELVQAEERSKKLRKQRQRQLRGESKTQTAFKNLGKKMRKGGISLLKGLSYAAQDGIGGVGSSLSSAAEYAF